MPTSIVISVIALAFSAISLGFTIFNVMRDRGRLRVWSEVYYDRSKNLENPPPSLKICMVNAGRRPIVLTSFVMVSPTMTWFSTIKFPDLPTNEEGYLKRLPRVEDFRAQHTCIALKEGEVFEHIIAHEDNDELFSIIEGELHCAKKIYLEDVLKRQYYVKDSEANIKKIFEFEKEPNNSMQPNADASDD